jgi:hypothetical protein
MLGLGWLMVGILHSPVSRAAYYYQGAQSFVLVDQCIIRTYKCWNICHAVFATMYTTTHLPI